MLKIICKKNPYFCIICLFVRIVLVLSARRGHKVRALRTSRP